MFDGTTEPRLARLTTEPNPGPDPAQPALSPSPSRPAVVGQTCRIPPRRCSGTPVLFPRLRRCAAACALARRPVHGRLAWRWGVGPGRRCCRRQRRLVPQPRHGSRAGVRRAVRTGRPEVGHRPCGARFRRTGAAAPRHARADLHRGLLGRCAVRSVGRRLRGRRLRCRPATFGCTSPVGRSRREDGPARPSLSPRPRAVRATQMSSQRPSPQPNAFFDMLPGALFGCAGESARPPRQPVLPVRGIAMQMQNCVYAHLVAADGEVDAVRETLE